MIEAEGLLAIRDDGDGLAGAIAVALDDAEMRPACPAPRRGSRRGDPARAGSRPREPPGVGGSNTALVVQDVIGTKVQYAGTGTVGEDDPARLREQAGISGLAPDSGTEKELLLVIAIIVVVFQFMSGRRAV